MRFYYLEEKLGDLVDWIPWRWALGPLVAWALVARAVEWLVWHGY